MSYVLFASVDSDIFTLELFFFLFAVFVFSFTLPPILIGVSVIVVFIQFKEGCKVINLKKNLLILLKESTGRLSFFFSVSKMPAWKSPLNSEVICQPKKWIQERTKNFHFHIFTYWMLQNFVNSVETDLQHTYIIKSH